VTLVRRAAAGGGVKSFSTVSTALGNVITTASDYSALVARVVLAAAIFPHGAQKLLGWFGGSGFSASMEHLIGDYGVPPALAFLTIVVEFVGPPALAVGFLTRVAALGIGAVMVGATVLVHLPFGFFMNWFGRSQGEGFEYHVVVLGLVAVLLIKGGGILSVDHQLSSKRSIADHFAAQSPQGSLRRWWY
jgi:putative oxidoreductase